MNQKATKTETVMKNDDKTWSFLHPTTNEWTGSYSSRDKARAARTALGAAKSTQTQSTSGAQNTSTTEDDAKKDVDSVATAPLQSSASTTSTKVTSHENNAGDVAQSQEKAAMIVTFTKSTKTRKSTSVVYNPPAGMRGSARFAKTFFKDGNAPDTLSIDSDAFSEPKVQLTAEQRKAARKNAPKLTPAEKLAKLQERANKLQEKIAKAAAAPAAPTAPTGDAPAQ